MDRLKLLPDTSEIGRLAKIDVSIALKMLSDTSEIGKTAKIDVSLPHQRYFWDFGQQNQKKTIFVATSCLFNFF